MVQVKGVEGVMQWWLQVNILFFFNKFLNFNLFKDSSNCNAGVVGTGNSCHASESAKEKGNKLFLLNIILFILYLKYDISFLF